MTLFDQCFAIVVGTEGGLTDDPYDPGGLTNWGISQRAYPDLDIRALTIDQAKAIYERDCWAKVQADRFAPAVALFLFDTAVNSGVGAAVRIVQEAADVDADGVIGPITLAAVQHASQAGTDAFMAELMARRIILDASLPGWAHDDLGWARRVCSLGYRGRALTS